MKKIVYILAGVALLSACSTSKVITVSKPTLTDKEQNMIENNSHYSTASIVGGGANIAKEEKAKLLQQQIEARKKKLRSIEGLNINSFQDENGKEQFKATVQNEILFKFDSYELNETAIYMLSELCEVISEIPETKIKIVGHTDNVGENNYNSVLSKNRASAVANFMRNSGVVSENIKEDGKGYSQPIADNKTEEGRAKNRRVEIFLSTPFE